MICQGCKRVIPEPPVALADSLQMALDEIRHKYPAEKILILTIAVRTAIDVIKGRCFVCRRREAA